MKMMPGQTPYTPEEIKRLQALVGSAIVAVEAFGEDELEYYTERKKRVEAAKSNLPPVDLVGCEKSVYAVMARVRAAATRAGWNAQRIGDFRGKLFTANNNEGYEAAMKMVATEFQVKS